MSERGLQISSLITAPSGTEALTLSFLCVALEEPLTLIFPALPLLPWYIFLCLSPKPLSLHSKSFLTVSPVLQTCDAWLSVFSKSPLVAGTEPPPLQQTEIKTHGKAPQHAAWKWENSEEIEGEMEEDEVERAKGSMDVKTPRYCP